MKIFKSAFLILLCCLLCFCTCGCESELHKEGPVASDAGFTVKFLNTGNSDCIIIKMDDINILIDSADTDDSDLILETLQGMGISKIHHFIITHFDNDHVGSAARVIYSVETEKIYAPNYVRDSKRTRNMEEAAKTHSSGVNKLTGDISFSTENGTVKIYTHRKNSYLDENSYSLITSITYGDRSFLFAGDATNERLEEFNDECKDKFDLIKTPHHGSFEPQFNGLINSSSVKYLVTCTDLAGSVDSALFGKAKDVGSKLFLTYEGEVTTVCDGTNINISQIAQ